MTKIEFLEKLRSSLGALNENDREERLNFYSEMIDDRIEEGVGEEEAVASIGSVDEIIEQIMSEHAEQEAPEQDAAEQEAQCKPEKDSQKENAAAGTDRKTRAWAIVLISVGFPLWLSLGIVAVALIITFYAVLWSVIASLFSVPASLGACAIAGLPACIALIIQGRALTGIALLGAGFVCAGLCIFSAIGMKYTVRGGVWLSKKVALGIASLFRKKESK